MPQKIGAGAVHGFDVVKSNWNAMSDAELHDIAMMQLSFLNDYHQQLTLRRQHLCQLRYERTKCEQQVTSCERMLRGHLQRLSNEQKRLANRRTLKEQTQMKMSAAAALATDVEKLKEKYSANECHLRKLVSEVELLTVQQQKQQQELNARVVSVGLLSADINRLSEEIAQTDKCNTEYDAQLNVKHEKLRQQQKYLEAFQQNITELNHQLESNDSKGISESGTFGILRQNTNYHSLPLGAKLWSLTDDTVQQIGGRTDAQHCQYTEASDMSTYEDETTSSKNTVGPLRSSNVTLSTAMISNVTSSSTFPATVNSERWHLQTLMDNGNSHSENLRNTSYRMIGRFAVQQGEMHQSLAGCLPASVDCDSSVSSSGNKSSDVAHSLHLPAESLHVRLPVTMNEPQELEHTLQTKDVVCSSPQPEIDELGPDISSPLSRLSVNADKCGQPVLLPDVIGILTDNATPQNIIERDKVSCSGSADTVPSLCLPTTAKVPPPVAQKPKFRYPRSAGYGVTDCDNVAVSTQPNAITTTPHNSVDILSTKRSLSLRQDFQPDSSQLNSMLDEPPMSKSGDLSQKITVSDDDRKDFTDCNRSVNRLTYKPSITYPVRRRRPSVGEGGEFSGDLQAKEDMISVAEDSAVCSEGNISRVQTVRNRLQSGMSRRVQFEPLALLLDAALEGEIDLLQTTLKVCDVSAANDEGITALHNAICAGHVSVAEYLVNCRCDVNAPDNDGWTPLHCAASCNNTAIAQLLVQHGACVFATTLSDRQKPSEKCEPDEDNYESCLHFLQGVEMQMREPGATVYAAFDYSAENADELTFSVGDQLTVMQCDDDIETEWWWCQLDEHKGYVPQNLIALHPRNVPEWTTKNGNEPPK